MQETRQYILEILSELGQATVDDIVKELCNRRGNITAVTVRHHLSRLQREGLISSPQLRHRSTPGRPQHIYTLTEQARGHFADNYPHLVSNLLKQLHHQLHPTQVQTILDEVAKSMAAEAKISEGSIVERVAMLVEYLNKHGYSAEWEQLEDEVMLRVCNCPYYEVHGRTNTICQIDLQLISSAIGVAPKVQKRTSEGGTCCIYAIVNHSNEAGAEPNKRLP